MTDDDPVPLKAGGEATPELVRALYALGRRGPDVARLARVAEKLGGTVADLPPPGSSNGLRKLIGTKTLITGLVIGLAALSWLGYHVVGRSTDHEVAPPPSATESSSVDPLARQTRQAIVASNRGSTDHFASTIPPAAEGPSDARHSGIATPRRSLHRAVPTQLAAAAPSQSPEPTVSSPAAVPGSAPTIPVASSVVEKPSPVQVQRSPTHAQAASEAQSSEVELLFGARKAMPAQPAAALRLLDEHAERFPNGLLGPEREVLTIEALRKLGRTAEAAQRLRGFESRYPQSIHLRRLQGEVGAL